MEEMRRSIDAFLQDETVTIALDHCSRTFTLSKALLCSASDYFSTALNGQFQEAADRTLRLPGCSEETFELFIYYMTHEKKLPDFYEIARDREGVWNDENCDCNQTARHSMIALVELWKFADACLMPRLQNRTLHMMCQVLCLTTIHPTIVRAAFTDTPEDSMLRLMLIGEVIIDVKNGELARCQERSKAITDELGAIPGFFSLFCLEQARYTEESSDLFGKSPSEDENWKIYRVAEKH